jgi:DNA-binding response OmpR family regulator
MPTVLIIADDTQLVSPIQYHIEALGYRVVVARDGRAGLRTLLDHQPEAVLLDSRLPGVDARRVRQTIRRFSDVPVIMLTALGLEVDRLRGVELGAGDYSARPFSFQELVAQIKSILLRVEEANCDPSNLRCVIGRITLDLAERRAFKGRVDLELRNKEYDLLELLMRQAGKVLRREDLLRQVWGDEWSDETRTLDVHIRRLRQKIEDNPAVPRYIQTVRNIGYRFATAAEIRL